MFYLSFCNGEIDFLDFMLLELFRTGEQELEML
jgi:hypothetical protein